MDSSRKVLCWKIAGVLKLIFYSVGANLRWAVRSWHDSVFDRQMCGETFTECRFDIPTLLDSGIDLIRVEVNIDGMVGRTRLLCNPTRQSIVRFVEVF